MIQFAGLLVVELGVGEQPHLVLLGHDRGRSGAAREGSTDGVAVVAAADLVPAERIWPNSHVRSLAAGPERHAGEVLELASQVERRDVVHGEAVKVVAAAPIGRVRLIRFVVRPLDRADNPARTGPRNSSGQGG